VTLVLKLLDDSCLGRERRVERLDVLFVSATALAPVNTTREGDRGVRIQVGSGVLDLTNQNVRSRGTKKKKLKINMKKKRKDAEDQGSRPAAFYWQGCLIPGNWI
jgi:hypothetical protein